MDKIVTPHIAVTVPKSIKWSDYEKELFAACSDQTLNYKVKHFPECLIPGKSKCFIVHEGLVKGFMHVSGLSEKQFTCTTTGKQWHGKFIERTGRFYPTVGEYRMAGQILCGYVVK